MMREDTHKIQHSLNPLHIFCRLLNKGFSKAEALAIVILYEEIIYEPVIIEILNELHGEENREIIDKNKEYIDWSI